VIDGYRGFVFMNRRKAVHNPSDLNRALERMRKDYNRKEEAAALEEDREAVLLPHFSAHNLHHNEYLRGGDGGEKAPDHEKPGGENKDMLKIQVVFSPELTRIRPGKGALTAPNLQIVLE